MKIVTLIIRTLIGLLFLFASITYFLKLIPEPVITGNLKIFQDGLNASVYLMPLAKAVELLCGLLYVSNRYMSLANIVLLPVTVNILLINVFLSPATIAIGLFVFVGNIFMIYRHWNSYQALFQAK